MRYQTGTSLSAARTTLLGFYSSVNTNIKIKVSLLLVIFFCTMAVTNIEVTSQSEEVVKQKKNINEPVELVSIKTEKKQIPLGEPFAKSDEWYKGLEFEIKNTSGKTINYIAVDLRFMRSSGIKARSKTDYNNLPFGIVIPLGEKSASSTENKSLVRIKPDEIFNIQLTEPYFNTLNDGLRSMGYPAGFKGVEVEIWEISFDEGSFWTKGMWYKPDPQNPDKLVPVKDKKFEENKLVSSLNPEDVACGLRTLDPYPDYCRNQSSDCQIDTEHIDEGLPELFKEDYIVRGCTIRSGPMQGWGCGEQRVTTYLTDCPMPTPTPYSGGCNGLPNYGQYPSGCAVGFIYSGGVCTRSPGFMNQCNRFGGYDPGSCGCLGDCDPSVGGCSPVVVDVLGNGFSMTSASDGVMFDLQGNGTPRQFSWIAADSDDSWLALDRNNNGLIDSGRELFGNVTSQPPPPDGEEMNGFLALAQYDTAAFGGNSDGKINQQDAIFSRLRLWQDANHNGISESCEMKTLPEVGLRKIDLDYRASRRTDQFGNQFKYRTKVRDAQDAQLGRWAWDVFLVLQH